MQFMNKSRFIHLWQRNLITNSQDNSTHVFQAVLDCYREDHRHYHNDIHIDHCLGMLEEVRLGLNNPDAVELAIWFHDVIYDSGATDNEQRSADWFMHKSGQYLNDSVRQNVHDLIMSTMHDNSPETDDERILVDIDLSSFGLSWERFQTDGDNVRKEQLHLTDNEFYRKQIKFQESLLQRAQFYFSDYFHRHYEAKARKNLSKHLDRLRSQGFHAEVS